MGNIKSGRKMKALWVTTVVALSFRTRDVVVRDSMTNPTKNLDNFVVLTIAGLAIISVVLDVRMLRPFFGGILVYILPGYTLINLGADALIFNWIKNINSLLVVIIKIVELAMGVLLSMVIVPVIGLSLGAGGFDLNLTAIILSLSFIVAISTVMDIFVRKKHFVNLDKQRVFEL